MLFKGCVQLYAVVCSCMQLYAVFSMTDIQSLLLDTCHFCRAIFHIGSSRVDLMFSSSDFGMRVAYSQIVSVWFAECHPSV